MKWITLLSSNRAIRKVESDINIQKISKKNMISDKLTNKENFIGKQNRVVVRESEMKRLIAPSFLCQSNTNSRGILPFIEGKAGRGNEITNKGNQSHVVVQGLDKANASVGDGELADAFQAVVDASTKSPSLDKEIIGGYREVEPTPVSVVENFFGGIGDAAKSTAEGLWDLATHPIDTAQNLGNAIAHPIDTGKAIYDSVSDSFKENVIDGDADTRARFAGRAIGEIGLGVAGTKGLDKAVKAIKAGENAAESAAILAKGSSKAVESEPLVNGPYIKNGKPNGRPTLSGEKKLQFEKDVYNDNVGPDGILRDPNEGDIIDWKPGQPRKDVVDFGHKSGYSYNDMFNKYKNGEITLDELKEFQFNSDNYRLETPPANRSHKYE